MQQRGGTTRRSAAASGFSLVEVLVVIAIIGLVLALALPSLNIMNRDARFTQAVSLVNGALARARLVALQEQQIVALRIAPDRWTADVDALSASDGDLGSSGSERQQLVLYRYVTPAYSWNGSAFELSTTNQFFDVDPDFDPVTLPRGIWAAPLDAIARPDDISNQRSRLELMLLGDFGAFATSFADPDGSQSKNDIVAADDFLLAYHPRSGLRPSAFHDNPDPNALRITGLRWPDSGDAPVPAFKGAGNNDDNLLARYNADALIFYDRAGFEALPNEIEIRNQYLREEGRPYYIHPRGAELVGQQ